MSLVVEAGRALCWLSESVGWLFGRQTAAQISTFKKVYTPKYFDVTDLTALDMLIDRDPFITLLSTNDKGEMLISHLPVIYTREGDKVVLEGHWAKGNPQGRADGAKAVVIVRGPHAYISAAWYPDKVVNNEVPTWNYAVAHLNGTLHVLNDDESKGSIVSRLSDYFEKTVESDWIFEHDNPGHTNQLRGIVGFRFEVDRIDMKFKLNQNKITAVESIAQGLDARGEPAQKEIASLMREYAQKRS